MYISLGFDIKNIFILIYAYKLCMKVDDRNVRTSYIFEMDNKAWCVFIMYIVSQTMWIKILNREVFIKIFEFICFNCFQYEVRKRKI